MCILAIAVVAGHERDGVIQMEYSGCTARISREWSYGHVRDLESGTEGYRIVPSEEKLEETVYSEVGVLTESDASIAKEVMVGGGIRVHRGQYARGSCDIASVLSEYVMCEIAYS